MFLKVLYFAPIKTNEKRDSEISLLMFVRRNFIEYFA